MNAMEALKKIYSVGGGQEDIDGIQGSKRSHLHSVIYGDGLSEQLPNDFEDVLDRVIEGSGKASDYSQLLNKPQINSNTLDGNISSEQLGLQAKLTAGENITIDNNVISAIGGESDVFVAEENVTTFQELKEEVLNNKLIFVTNSVGETNPCYYQNYNAVSEAITLIVSQSSGVSVVIYAITENSGWSKTATEFQEKLRHGYNLKTIFGNSILGKGNVSIPIASDWSPGAVIVGDGLSVESNGLLSVDDNSFFINIKDPCSYDEFMTAYNNGKQCYVDKGLVFDISDESKLLRVAVIENLYSPVSGYSSRFDSHGVEYIFTYDSTSEPMVLDSYKSISFAARSYVSFDDSNKTYIGGVHMNDHDISIKFDTSANLAEITLNKNGDEKKFKIALVAN